MTIGENLKRIRKEKGITQEQLAKMLDLSVMSIRRFESGAVEPKLKMINKIAEALGVKSSDLLLDVAFELPSDQKEIQAIADRLPRYKLLEAFERLNYTGKWIAAERIQELTEIERYTEQETLPDQPQD